VTSFTHTGLTGGTTYSYRVCVADNVGNVASGATASYTAPTLDTTAPRARSRSTVVRLHRCDRGALNLAATDAIGVTGYYVSTSATAPSAGAAGWTAVTATTSYSGTVAYTLATPDGSKTVYGWYKDAADNVSAVASDSITLDQTAPSNGR